MACLGNARYNLEGGSLVSACKDRDFKIKSARWIDLKLQNLGFYADRLMWWCNTEPSNFGDWVGPTIFHKKCGVWPKLAPVYLRPNHAPVHFTAGSILESCHVPGVAIVWGTGIMNKNAKFSAPRDIYAVRGPLTAARCRELGYKCPDILGDPGIVLPKFFPKISGSSFQLGIIPHFVDQELAAHAIERSSEVKIIDVTRSVAEVISDIQSCELLVSSSLHGVIISHAFGRPCAWVRFGETLAGDGTKFHDYFGSVGIFDHPGAITIDQTVSISELKKISQKSPTPDLSVVADKLLEVCPF
jgi:hypothetical protein